MKNRKIIALLCAMAMIVTTLSSIFVVTAAAEPQIVINTSEPDDNGQYTISVGYEGYEGVKIGALSLKLPIPEGSTYVEGSLTGDPKFTLNYNASKNRINMSGADLNTLFDASGSGVICSFKITLNSEVTSDISFAFSEGSITDQTDAATPVDYEIGSADKPIKVSAQAIEYVEPWVDGQPRFGSKYVVNEDGTVTVTLTYDFSKVTEKACTSLTLKLLMGDSVTLVENSLKSDNAKLTLNAPKNAKVNVSAADLNNIFAGETGDICSFTVKLADGVTEAKLSYETIEATVGGNDYSIDSKNLSAPAVKVAATAEPTVEPTEAPTVEPTEAPTVEPTEAPTAEPTQAPTTEPTKEPSTSDEYSIVAKLEKTTVEINGASFDTYNIVLSQNGDNTMPEKVHVILQGWNGKSVAGNAMINNVDTDNMSNLSAYVKAKTVKLIVVDAETGEVVAKPISE